jgi:hypothetical protein
MTYHIVADSESAFTDLAPSIGLEAAREILAEVFGDQAIGMLMR